MKLERIRQVLPNGVVTDHGFRTVIGDQPLYPGGFVHVHNDKVVGFVRKPQFVPRGLGESVTGLLIARYDGKYEIRNPKTLEFIREGEFKNWPTEYIDGLSGFPQIYVACNKKYAFVLVGIGDYDQNMNRFGHYACFDLLTDEVSPVYEINAGYFYNYHGFYFEVSESGDTEFGGMFSRWEWNDQANFSDLIVVVDKCTNGNLSRTQTSMHSLYGGSFEQKIQPHIGLAQQKRNIVPQYHTDYVRYEDGNNNTIPYPGMIYMAGSISLHSVGSLSSSVNISPAQYDGTSYSDIVAGNPKTNDFVARINSSAVSSVEIRVDADFGSVLQTYSNGVTQREFFQVCCLNDYISVNPLQYLPSAEVYDGLWVFPKELYYETTPSEISVPNNEVRGAEQKRRLYKNSLPLLHNSELSGLVGTPGQLAYTYIGPYGSGNNQYVYLRIHRWELVDGQWAWVANGKTSGDAYPSNSLSSSRATPISQWYGGWMWSFPYVETGTKTVNATGAGYQSGPNSTNFVPSSVTKKIRANEIVAVDGVYALNINSPSEMKAITESVKLTAKELYYPSAMTQSAEVRQGPSPNSLLGPDGEWLYTFGWRYTALGVTELVTFGVIYYGDGPKGSGQGGVSLNQQLGGETRKIPLPYSAGGLQAVLSIGENQDKTVFIGDIETEISYYSGDVIAMNEFDGVVYAVSGGEIYRFDGNEKTTDYIRGRQASSQICVVIDDYLLGKI